MEGELVAIRKAYFLGKKYNKLLIVGYTDPIFDKRGYAIHMAKCICDCGNECVVRLFSIKSGYTKSCGCLLLTNSANTTHGMSRTRVYKIWDGMKERCRNPNNISYPRYGGRGIKICKEWVNNFSNFYSWAINNGYKDGLQIDRFPNKDGDYKPSNCRWATPKQNSRNKANNTIITIDGVSKCMAEWADFSGVDKDLIGKRIAAGWDFKKAVFSAPDKSKNGFKNGNNKLTREQILQIYTSRDSVKSLCAKYLVGITTIYNIKSGDKWSDITGAAKASKPKN